MEPPALNETASEIPDNLGIAVNRGEKSSSPPAPVVLNARHVHHLPFKAGLLVAKSAEGILTVYANEYRFEEASGAHSFSGPTADLLANCHPQKESCTVQTIVSGHKEVIRIAHAEKLWEEGRRNQK